MSEKQEFNEKKNKIIVKDSPNEVERPLYYSCATNEDFAKAYCGFRSFQNIDGPISSYPELTWHDYECFRPSEAIPKTYPDIVAKCDEIYEECIIIKNIVDLMADFICKGVRISHPQPSRRKFYEELWKKWNGTAMCERFCNYLYRFSNNFIQRVMTRQKITRGEQSFTVSLPSKYIFINPGIVQIEDEEYEAFVGKFRYFIDLSNLKKESKILNVLKLEDTSDESKRKYLDDDKFIKVFFKKHDWKAFATPYLYGFIKEVSMLAKLDLSERTALDSAIDRIRIITLGDMENKIVPSPDAFSKLDHMMQANTGGGRKTIFWGPDIKLIESTEDLSSYLGFDKYIPVMRKIYDGAGIALGNNNSQQQISLNVMLERLWLGRQLLTDFLNAELALVAQAIGDTMPAEVEYDINDFTNKEAHRALLIQLADRNLISDELLQHAFNHNSTMESRRTRSEETEYDKNKKVRKLGPFAEKDFEKSLIKTLLQKNMISPDSLTDIFKKLNNFEVSEPEDDSGPYQPGRPVNSKDKSPRQRRTFKPIQTASTQIWVDSMQKEITEFVRGSVLEHFGKKNIRELTSKEFQEYEDFKIGVLFNIQKDDVDIARAVSTPINYEIVRVYKQWISQVSSELERDLTTNEKNTIQAILYCHTH